MSSEATRSCTVQQMPLAEKRPPDAGEVGIMTTCLLGFAKTTRRNTCCKAPMPPRTREASDVAAATAAVGLPLPPGLLPELAHATNSIEPSSGISASGLSTASDSAHATNSIEPSSASSASGLAAVSAGSAGSAALAAARPATTSGKARSTTALELPSPTKFRETETTAPTPRWKQTSCKCESMAWPSIAPY